MTAIADGYDWTMPGYRAATIPIPAIIKSVLRVRSNRYRAWVSIGGLASSVGVLNRDSQRPIRPLMSISVIKE
jgi:hypothetical protein